MRKSLKIIIITLSSVLSLILLVAALVSPIAKNYIEKNSRELLGRQVYMDKLQVNIFAGSVRIVNAHISEADFKTDFVAFDTLYVDMAIYRLLAKEVHLDHILLSNIKVDVVRADSAFNFSDIIERFASTDTIEEVDTTSSNWAIALYDIRLRNGFLAYMDKPLACNWNLDNLNLYVPGVYFGGESTHAGLSCSFPDGGDIATQVKYDMAANRYNIDLQLNGINLNMISPLLTDYLQINSLNGSLTADINVNGNLDELLDVNVGGTLQLDTLCITDLQQKKIISLTQTKVDAACINPQQNKYDLNSIAVDGLSGTFTLYADGTNTIDRLLVAQPDTVATADSIDIVQTDTIPSEPLNLLVRKTTLTNTSVTFNDNTRYSPMSYSLTKMYVEMGTFTNNSENDIRLHAQLPEGGTLIARWKGTLDFMHSNQLLSLIIKNVHLEHFAPYSEYYVGNKLTGGTLSFTSENLVHNAQLKGTNKVDIYNCTVSDKDHSIKAEYSSIPVKLAVSLLKDINGKIMFNIPVSGDLSSPKFSYGKIVWQTIMNLMIKAAASPFMLAAQAIGLSGTDLQHITLDAMQPDFTSQQYDSFSKLAEIAKSEENIHMVIEQELPLKTVAQEQAIFNLKQSYYQDKNGKTGEKYLSLTDMEEISKIKNTDSGLASYTDRLTGLTGKSLVQKASTFYSNDSVQNQVLQLAEFRNLILTNYFVKKMNVPAEKIEIRTKTADELLLYSGKSQYSVSIQMPEVQTETESAE